MARRSRREKPKRTSDSKRTNNPFAMPDTGFGVMVPAKFEQRASLLPLLLPFGIKLNTFGKQLLKRWDAEADSFYLMGVRAIAGWLATIHALAMPLRVASSERNKPDGLDHLAFLNLQHHAWFEATLHLGDSLAAGLSGHPRAAGALIRPFIENAVVEVFVNGDLEGERLAEYLRYLRGTGARPRWGNSLRTVFAEERFAGVASLRKTIELLYSGASATLHVRTPEESALDWRAGNRAEATYPETVYWFGQLAFAVHRMLALMAIRFPMVLFPVDLIARFAYSGPMNLFVDEVTSSYIRDGLGHEHAAALRRYLSGDEEVRSLMDFYESQPHLTNSQIEEDWSAWVKSRPEWARHANVPIERRLLIRKAISGSMIWAGDHAYASRFIPDPAEIDPDRVLAADVIAEELRPHYPRRQHSRAD